MRSHGALGKVTTPCSRSGNGARRGLTVHICYAAAIPPRASLGEIMIPCTAGIEIRMYFS